MTEMVTVAVIAGFSAAAPLVMAQVVVIYTTRQTHKLVNAKMTAALSKIESLEGEIRGLRAIPPVVPEGAKKKVPRR